jgi:DNA-binding protein HU-beta
MNQSELIRALAEESEVTQVQAKVMLEALGNIVLKEIKSGETVALPVLGRFSSKASAERKCRNPRTGEEMTVPAKTKIAFSPSANAKEAVAK